MPVWERGTTQHTPAAHTQTGNKTFHQGLSKPFDIRFPRISKGPRLCFPRRENGPTCVQSSSWSFFPDTDPKKHPRPGDRCVPGSSPAPLLSGWVPGARSAAWARPRAALCSVSPAVPPRNGRYGRSRHLTASFFSLQLSLVHEMANYRLAASVQCSYYPCNNCCR